MHQLRLIWANIEVREFFSPYTRLPGAASDLPIRNQPVAILKRKFTSVNQQDQSYRSRGLLS